jgi:hypothetical protein
VTPDYAPKGIGRLIDEAIAVYRAEFRTLALPAAFLLLPMSLLIALAQASYLRAVTSAGPAATDPFEFFFAIAGAYGAFVGAAGLSGLLSLYYFSAVLNAAPSLMLRRPVEPGAFLRGGWRRFLILWVVSIIVGLAYGVGLLFLLFPGLVIYAYLSMAEPIIGVEGAPIDVALRRSVRLVRENLWRTVGFFVAVFVIVASLQSALTSVTSVQLILGVIAGGSSGSSVPSFGWQVLGGLLQGVAQTVTLPLFYVAWLLFYFDLRSRREGMDLLARAQTLATRSA